MPSVSLAPLRRCRIAVLPDLYIDALVGLPAWPQAARRLGAIAARGGGNLPVGPIEFKLGGNAANLALALARLGAEVDLIARTDELGRQLLERAAQGTRLGLEGVRVGDHASATLALECGAANVMLSHSGPLLDFGPARLTAADWRRIEGADAVAVTNWSQNRRGTALLRAVSRRVARRGGLLHFDAGDVRHRGRDTDGLLRDRVAWQGVTAFGLNENELGALAGGKTVAHAQALAARLGTRIDLHTRHWAASATADGAVRVAASQAPALRRTGAGDAWNAGNLVGDLLGLDHRERLRLAHRVATRYVTGRSGLPPTAAQLSR